MAVTHFVVVCVEKKDENAILKKKFKVGASTKIGGQAMFKHELSTRFDLRKKVAHVGFDPTTFGL